MTPVTLVQVTAPSFCAAVVAREGTILAAAPILGPWRGKPLATFLRHAKARRWDARTVPGPHPDRPKTSS